MVTVCVLLKQLHIQCCRRWPALASYSQISYLVLSFFWALRCPHKINPCLPFFLSLHHSC